MFYMFSNEKIVSDKFKVISIEGFTPSKELINNHLATIEEIEARKKKARVKNV